MADHQALNCDNGDEDGTWVSAKVDLIGFAVGVVLALVMNLIVLDSPLLPTDNMKFLSPCMFLIGVGAEYFGCALVSGSFKAMFFELLCMVTIPLVTIQGMAYWPPLVAIVWALHPLLDVLHHPAYFRGLARTLGVVKLHPKMSWYCAACASFDIVQALLVQYAFLPRHPDLNLVPAAFSV